MIIWERGEEYNNLKNLSKDQLIQIISDYHYTDCLISEALVEESKMHRSSEDTVRDIRKYLRDMPHYSFWSEDLAEYVGIQMQRSWIEYMWETEKEVFGDDCKDRRDVVVEIGDNNE